MIKKAVLSTIIFVFALFGDVRSQNFILESNGGNFTGLEQNGLVDNLFNLTDLNVTEAPLVLPFEILNFNMSSFRNLRAKKEQRKYNCSFKCIVSDLDGSLADVGSHFIAESNSIIFGDILSSNIQFFPATGKSFTSSMKFITNGLKNSLFTGFPGVYYNGALVFGPGGIKDVLYETRIHSGDALEIIKYIKKFAVSNEKSLRFESNRNGNSKYEKISNKEEKSDESADSLRLLNIAIENSNGLFVDGFEGENMREYINQEIDSMVHKGVNLSKFLEPREGEKIKGIFKIVVVENPDVLLHLREHLETFVKMYGCKIYRSVPNLLEIIPQNASKLNGTKLILKKLKLKFHQVAYLGDSENDLEIMSKVGFPIAAMGSSPAISYVSRAVQTFSPETSFASLVGEYCEAECNKKKLK
ncbi:haloacid dehalogenase family-like horizontal transfer into apicomplexans [Cryptosporidium sp. chipmunk genotype I]|uniref:haloacid dehalogenase family-like horizontal transfer into apicomplexans n=1 Tax=Cryptosporidium sp. chipmunk genotype I TaxID=1280935 RepID=UPI00351A6920|nr:haloacid dehalogenase family-like horizontal transfer into apicomplexans [Cryptosporidium sp. chipmunk genotype I]